jgi:DNA-directed RNA polymerase specialized sigma24 family protein
VNFAMVDTHGLFIATEAVPDDLWTVALHAGRDEPTRARAALAQFCQAYWYPLYSFVRHRGYSPHDAQNLTQAFFVQLLEKRALERVDPEQGRFRTFLLASLKNFLANDWDRSHARKRGGGQTTSARPATSIRLAPC